MAVLTTPAFDLSSLKESIAQRRAMRKSLRDSTADLTKDLTKELRAGDSITLGAVADPWADSGADTARTYGVMNVCVGLRAALDADRLGDLEVSDFVTPAFFCKGSRGLVVLHDPRKDSYEDPDTGQEYVKYGRFVYDPEARVSRIAPENFEIPIATDEDLIDFAADAPQVMKAFHDLMAAEVARMATAVKGLNDLRYPF